LPVSPQTTKIPIILSTDVGNEIGDQWAITYCYFDRNSKFSVAKIGVGEKAKATVILKDGTKKKDYIGQAGDDDFA